MSSEETMDEAEIVVGDEKVAMAADGTVVRGGHAISEDDYNFMVSELREQFNCLSGRIYGVVDALGMTDKQSKAIKRLLKNEVWERFHDFSACMKDFSRVKYTSVFVSNGYPLDEVEA